MMITLAKLKVCGIPSLENRREEALKAILKESI